jgi:hypothetical protein
LQGLHRCGAKICGVLGEGLKQHFGPQRKLATKSCDASFWSSAKVSDQGLLGNL